MKLKVFENEDLLAQELGNLILEKMREDVLITLPSGDTPSKTYKYLVTKFQENPFEIKATFVGLDEWVGLDKNDYGSCQYYMHRDLYDLLPIEPNQLIEFDAKAADLEAECKRMDQVIGERKISLVVLGIGMNGHLALNEPGVNVNLKSHFIDLDEKTKRISQKYFDKETELTKGITLGIQYFLECDELFLIATGERKHSIVKTIMETEPTNQIPASLAKMHEKSVLMVDKKCYNEVSDNE